MTLRQFALWVKKHKNIKPGRFMLMVQELNKSGVSFRNTATPNRIAWVLLYYAAFPGSRDSLFFKDWQSEQKPYFDKLNAEGETNPLDFLTKILSIPNEFTDIAGVGICGGTMTCLIYRKDFTIKFLTKQARLPDFNLCNYAYFSFDLLQSIAEWLKNADDDYFKLK